ncbi:MAG: ATP-binding protein [Acidobacteriota bacterium]
MGARFFLGRPKAAGESSGAPGRYELDADRLTTHAAVIGMTGSGKTGLLVNLLEEAALAGVPTLVLDPKGDLTNRLLVFPDYRPEDFAPFAPVGRAAETAERWKAGVEAFGPGPDAARSLARVPVRVLTPGAELRPVNVLERFACPPVEERAEVALSAAASLMALADLPDDPATSPEGLLLSHLLLDLWDSGSAPSLEDLVRQVLSPRLQRIGVLDLDTVIPPKERTALALRLNALLASPALAAWRSGAALDLDEWLNPASAGAQTVLTLSHLPESQRLFFLGLLLGELASWTRRQTGSDSLRALVVFDEVFGYFPPHPANPPTKAPLLTLLKQARAFGVGVVLATQNPVDLDYKGLTNAGLWFLGRLQTEPDRRRVADALGALPGGVDAAERLGEIAPRTFLVHDVKRDAPLLMETRHCVSFLAGPLALPQLERLLGAARPAPAPGSQEGPRSGGPPTVPAGWSSYFSGTGSLVPHLAAEVQLSYRTAPKAPPVSLIQKVLWPLGGATLEADLAADPLDAESLGTETWPGSGSSASPLPAYFSSWKPDRAAKAAAAALALRRTLNLLKDPVTGEMQAPGEPEASFRGRVSALREARRAAEETKALDPLRRRLDRAEDRVRQLEIKVESQRSESKARSADTALSVGLGVLGGLLGSKRSLGGAISRTASKKRMADRAEDRLEALESDLADARAERDTAAAALAAAREEHLRRFLGGDMEAITLLPAARGGVQILSFGILWKPRS